MCEKKFILLSKEERDRFATYLEQEAETGSGLIEQFKKLPGKHGEIIAMSEQRAVDAALVIAKKLRSTEDVTIT